MKVKEKQQPEKEAKETQKASEQLEKRAKVGSSIRRKKPLKVEHAMVISPPGQ